MVGGDLEAAALLYRAGLHSLYTPVTWYEARAGSLQGSISDCDWSAVSGREVVIWLDDECRGVGQIGTRRQDRLMEAGAASLHVVDSSGADRRRRYGGADRTGVAQAVRGW